MTTEEKRFGVFLNDTRAGTLNQRGDYTWFVLDEDYMRDPSRAVLGLIFEENPTAKYASALRLPPWFGNLLPEGRLREWVAADRGVSVQREMELLAHVGHDLPGAVRVILEDVPPDDDGFEEFAPDATDLTSPGHWHFSLAGVGMKFSMVKQSDRLTLPAEGVGGNWIVKLPDSTYPNVPQNEFAMMSLASAIGIDVPEHQLIPRSSLDEIPEKAWLSHEQIAYAVKRFDRLPGGERVHIEDFAQIRNFPSDDISKYQGTFETVAALCYRGFDLGSLDEFVKRMTFNVLISNGDAHLKNWSLIYRDPTSPVLSPVYDLVSTSVYASNPDDANHLGLKFGGTARLSAVRVSAFERLGERLRVDGRHLVQVAKATVERVSDAWPSVAPVLDSAPAIQQAVTSSIAERRTTFLQ